jgi:predicted CoA-binding protein
MDAKRRILQEVETIAVVGLSSDEARPGYTVPAYMQSQGYHIIPVNPYLDAALGEKAYPDLLSVPEPVDMVLIFRRPEFVPPVVAEAIEIGADVVWMQLGIVNEEAAARARVAGLEVVMDSCIAIDHRRLMARGS